MATILVVEHNFEILEILAAIARAGGHEVVAVDSSDRALEVLGSGRHFDLLLTDAAMPVKSHPIVTPLEAALSH